MNNTLKTYVFMVLCTILISTPIMPINPVSGKKAIHTKAIQTPSIRKESTFTESFTYPIFLGLGIGVGLSITSACIGYLYKNSLQEWFTKIGENAIRNNVHKFPIHVNIPQEDVPVWVKWLVASLPTLLNQKLNNE